MITGGFTSTPVVLQRLRISIGISFVGKQFIDVAERLPYLKCQMVIMSNQDEKILGIFENPESRIRL